MTWLSMSSTLRPDESALSFALLYRLCGSSADTANRAVDELGGKTKAMELLAFKDSEVRFYALMAVQRLVQSSQLSSTVTHTVRCRQAGVALLVLKEMRCDMQLV